MSDFETRFGAIARLYGDEGLRRIRESHVMIVGLGGVGAWTCESLARSGIGRLTLIDMDEICLSNINRQIHSLNETVGQSKVAVLKDRIRSIAPECVVDVRETFFTEENASSIFDLEPNMIVDAIDTTKHKSLLIAGARKRGIPVITCGGAGGKIDPTRVMVEDLARTINDPLLLQVRKRLRRDYEFPKFKRQKFRVKCVFSDEEPLFPTSDGNVSHQREPGEDYRINCDFGFGSVAHVTATFGLVMAAEVLRELTKKLAV